MNKSEKVKAWRHNTKSRIIEAMGGKCQCCGYDRYPEIFDLHHLDPNEKDFTISSARANPRSWEKLCAELRKCVLLCSNCHREVHAGYRDVPADVQGFNENYSDYRQETINNSPTPQWKTYCSRSCAARSSRKVDWDSIDLASLLSQHSYVKIGEMLDVSDVAVRKRAKKLGLR